MIKWLRCLAAVCLAVLLAAIAGAAHQREEEQEPVRQVLVSFEDLDYPFVPRAVREQGLVVVDLRLDDKGVPVSASALTGPASLIPYATANAKKWRFAPNRQRRAISFTTSRSAVALATTGREVSFSWSTTTSHVS